MDINWELTISAISAIIAGLSIGFSVYSFFSFKKLNKKVLEQQLEINHLLITKEQKYSNEQNKADFRAYTIGSKANYQLILTNVGKATAENVYLEILIDSKYRGHFWNIDNIFPMNIVSGHSGKLSYSRGMDFPSKFTVRISWDDQLKKQNSKDIEIVS
ncbi:hypothetical protein [Acinetobacter sp.]|jgi:uncharacterized repeat protein (TIGR01451 family)|uniref:hypothetical protein n=1 Tax=Acinetobacter sp. TaxID=472 RepID=UPI0028A95BA7|nr:hypothetical protein [Acinetobacter sp.]